VVPVPMSLLAVRRRASQQRRFALEWSRVSIATPYRPRPHEVSNGLIGRLQTMLGTGLADRPVRADLEPVPLRGDQATALALVFCELFSNAVEHGAGGIGVELARTGADIVLTVSDAGNGPAEGAVDGLGLTIARTLVRDQLAGALELRADHGGRAVARFPAAS